MPDGYCDFWRYIMLVALKKLAVEIENTFRSCTIYIIIDADHEWTEFIFFTPEVHFLNAPFLIITKLEPMVAITITGKLYAFTFHC